MNREEHLQWCKNRAIEYINSGYTNNAFASFFSDMLKHEETANHLALDLMAQLFFSGQLNSPNEMKKFINDFN